jgi:triose/dihydroxyacetone kinase / FAD-AMP lyase (cyclizing)
MKKLINGTSAVVRQCLEGAARLNPELALLGDRDTVVRADLNELRAEGKVAIVSGGGAGHEPAHAGYVGRGMLTAAVSGDVFASPSTDAVLEALRAVRSSGGTLLIVKNYTGDRLNFGLAAEIARAEGDKVELVVVDDDVALGSAEETAGRRGIAGTVLIHKIAGAAAEAGLGLHEVADLARKGVSYIGSMGVALSPCTVPAAGQPNFELGPDEIELGLGIHGEPGVERAQLMSSAALVKRIVDEILIDRQLSAGEDVVLMINNLGGTPPSEQLIVANDALNELALRGLKVVRAWCGTFLTAIEMAGVSLSIMRADDELLQAIDAPTTAPAWPKAVGVTSPAELRRLPVRPPARLTSGRRVSDRDNRWLTALEAACRSMVRAEAELTRMDMAVGDGDIGRSLAKGAQAVLAQLDRLSVLDDRAMLAGMADIIRDNVGGTSGPLYAILAMGASHVLSQPEPANKHRSVEAFAAGVAALAELGGARVGDSTMLDALHPAVHAAQTTKGNLSQRLAAAAKAAKAGAAATAAMRPRRGRSSYVGDRAIGAQDPGAAAVAIWLEAAVSAFD